MDDWEIHFREKSARRSKRRNYDLNVIGIVLVAAVGVLILLIIISQMNG